MLCAHCSAAIAHKGTLTPESKIMPKLFTPLCPKTHNPPNTTSAQTRTLNDTRTLRIHAFTMPPCCSNEIYTSVINTTKAAHELNAADLDCDHNAKPKANMPNKVINIRNPCPYLPQTPKLKQRNPAITAKLAKLP